MTRKAEVAVIGGGIVGLAFAWTAARAGRSVVLFERDRKAQGASIRNFGMIWPIGQSAGTLHRVALRSRELWSDLAPRAGIDLDPVGSLHLAYQADERTVLEEFTERSANLGYDCRLLTSSETLKLSPSVQPKGLLGALWSPTEACVDPRQAIARIPGWLAENHDVELRYGSVVTSVEMPEVRTSDGERWEVERTIVCGGSDFRTLFPAVFEGSGIRLCKLQMMRTVPQPGGWRLGPMLAGGLTLGHYASFQACPSLGVLKQRFMETMPDFVRLGIHVMASQNSSGEVVIGDSHEYDEAIEPFDKPTIDDLILGYLRGMVALPEPTIASKWHGIYPKHPSKPLFTAEPQPGVKVVTAPGGAGMTMSFGFAEQLWEFLVWLLRSESFSEFDILPIVMGLMVVCLAPASPLSYGLCKLFIQSIRNAGHVARSRASGMTIRRCVHESVRGDLRPDHRGRRVAGGRPDRPRVPAQPKSESASDQT